MVEVYALPEGGRYAKARRYGPGDELRSENIPGLVLPVAAILG